MEEKILRDLLIEGYTISKISKINSLEENEVCDTLEKYNIDKRNKGLLKEIYADEIEVINENIIDILNQGKNNVIIHYRILKLFLVHAYSKRSICRIIEQIPKDGNNGTFAQQIINKTYKLKESNRGSLFLHEKERFEKIIRKILIYKKMMKMNLK